jgi:hypothetical protein
MYKVLFYKLKDILNNKIFKHRWEEPTPLI